MHEEYGIALPFMNNDQLRIAALKELSDRVSDSRGSTSPNPPVGACALSESGSVLGFSIHQGSGTAHAEAMLLTQLQEAGKLEEVTELWVTLEPCNHTGKTPPCTNAILSAVDSLRDGGHFGFAVGFGAFDPNPKVKGGGAKFLKTEGIEILDSPKSFRSDCERLIAPFKKWVLGKGPYLTLKAAMDSNLSMIPPEGQKTFCSDKGLLLAHQLRKRADAILTTSNTILADNPLFTVRHLADHARTNGNRVLAILDKNKRVPNAYIEAAKERGFQVEIYDHFEGAMIALAQMGVHEVLVEAGPTLYSSLKSEGKWDEIYEIQMKPDGSEVVNHLIPKAMD